MTDNLRKALHEMSFYDLVCIAKNDETCDCENENCGCEQGEYCTKNNVLIHPEDAKNHLRWIKERLNDPDLVKTIKEW